jgi:hypothetical protein
VKTLSAFKVACKHKNGHTFFLSVSLEHAPQNGGYIGRFFRFQPQPTKLPLKAVRTASCLMDKVSVGDLLGW